MIAGGERRCTASAMPVADDRRDARVMTVHRTCGVEATSGHGLCVIRNLSAGGAMIRTVVPLAVDDTLVLVMASGMRIGGSVRWTRAPEAGVRFDAAQDLSTMLDRGGVANGEPYRRMPRLAIALPATVVQDGVQWQATTCDISSHGARLGCATGPARGPVRLHLPRLRPLAARVLWMEAGQFGCVLDSPLGIDELTHWLVEMERR